MSDTENSDVVPELYESVFVKKENVFLSGAGGNGKTYQVKQLAKIAKKRFQEFHITSTTGVSAIGVGGMTIHKWSGICIANDIDEVESIVKKIHLRKYECKQRWLDCETLVIDEISMLSDTTLDIISEVGKRIRKNKDPFGGLQIIFTGDFLQIKPVNGNFAFYSDVWNDLDMQTIQLTTAHRFTDKVYSDLLCRVRVGKQTQDDINLLKSRVESYHEYTKNYKLGDIQPTKIYATNYFVNNHNQRELNVLEGQLFTYEATDKIMHLSEKNSNEMKLKDKNASGILGKKKRNFIKLPEAKQKECEETLSCLVNKKLCFKVNCQVMLTRNLDVENFLANGSRGIIVECSDNYIDVKFHHDNITHRIEKFEFEHEDNTVYLYRKQFPLKLAFASSIHKSQGSTLDFVSIAIDRTIFQGSIAYVALSRVRNLNGLLLSSFDPDKLYCNKDALQFEKDIGLIDDDDN